MSIKAFVNYHVDGPMEEGREYVNYKVIRGDIINDYILERAEIQVEDVTNFKPDLRKLGFTWTVDSSRTFSSEEVQREDVIQEYNDGLIALMRQENKDVAEIRVFDHTVRCDTLDDNKRAKNMDAPPESKYRPVALHVHGDYTEESAAAKLLAVVGEEEAATWQAGHWGIVNIWRPLDFPIERTPLAFIDPTTVRPEDWVVKEIHIPGRVGHIKGFLNNPNYRWIMMDHMPTDRVWIFTQYDSQDIPWVPHSALEIANTPPEARPRRSIESRMCVRYHK